MAGWLHGVFVGDWLFVFPLCGFSLSLFCNYASWAAPETGPCRQQDTYEHIHDTKVSTDFTNGYMT